MKILKILGILIAVYVGIVVIFESLLGYFQPMEETSLVITITEPDGTQRDRVLTAIENDGELYVAANHWPRAWYRAVKANPDVTVTLRGETSARRAVEVTPEEHRLLDTEVQPLPFLIRFLTGFPPRYFVRLEAR